MSYAAQQAKELETQIKRLMNNNHPDRANDPTAAWSDICCLEAEMVACQKIAEEEAAEESFNGGQFGLGV